MSIKSKYKQLKEKKEAAKLERQRLEDKREQEEYIKRQERYNDMLRDEAQKQKFIMSMSRIKINTYTKKMVTVILSFCIICIGASYVLAFMGKDNTLEALSTQLCITILGVAFVYMIRAYFDSKAEHRNLDNQIKEEIEEGLIGKMKDTLSNAGLTISNLVLNNNGDSIADDVSEDDLSEIKPPIQQNGLFFNNDQNNGNTVG